MAPPMPSAPLPEVEGAPPTPLLVTLVVTLLVDGAPPAPPLPLLEEVVEEETELLLDELLDDEDEEETELLLDEPLDEETELPLLDELLDEETEMPLLDELLEEAAVTLLPLLLLAALIPPAPPMPPLLAALIPPMPPDALAEPLGPLPSLLEPWEEELVPLAPPMPPDAVTREDSPQPPACAQAAGLEIIAETHAPVSVQVFPAPQSTPMHSRCMTMGRVRGVCG